MLTHQAKVLSHTFILLVFCSLSSICAAREPVLVPEYGLENLSQNTPSEPLPLGTLLDSEGKPLAIPAEQSALEYSSPTVNVDEAKTKQTTKSTTAKKKKPSRKQQLISRDESLTTLVAAGSMPACHNSKLKLATDPTERRAITPMNSVPVSRNGNASNVAPKDQTKTITIAANIAVKLELTAHS